MVVIPTSLPMAVCKSRCANSHLDPDVKPTNTLDLGGGSEQREKEGVIASLTYTAIEHESATELVTQTISSSTPFAS